jgi:MMPL family
VFAALPSLGSEVNSDPSLFLAGSARSVQAATLGGPLLGARDTSKITIVAATSDGRLTSADLAALTREAKLARQVTGVQSVRYVALSPDGNAVQLTATVSRDTSDVAGLKPVVAALQATFARADTPPGLRIHLAGQVATNAANNASANKAMGRIGVFSILLIIVLVLIVLRSPVAVVITFVPSLVAPLYLVVTIAASYLAALGLTTFLVITLAGRGGSPGHRPHRAHGNVGRADPGRHIRGLRGGRRRRHGRAATGDRAGPGARRAAGHVRRQDAARAVDRGAARPLELVAVPAGVPENAGDREFCMTGRA